MANLNKVIIAGNLTRDPERRYTRDGIAVTTFSVAVNRYFRDKTTGEVQSKVDYIPVVVWGRQAETCKEYLTKGRGVIVEGMLTSRSWETSDGEKRTRLEVFAQRIQFLPRGVTVAPEEETVEEDVIDEVIDERIEEEPPEDIPF